MANNEEPMYGRMLLYYHGEDRCPYKQGDIKTTFWELEQLWSTQVCVNELMQREHVANLVLDFGDQMRKLRKYPSLGLIGFFYDRHLSHGGTRDTFLDFLNTYSINA